MLVASDLSLHEGGVTHLGEVSLSFAPGQMTVLLGRTGAGKTTLLRAIAGLTLPQRGTVTLNGQDWARLPPWKRPVAMVTQQFINYPHLSALDNVAFPLLRAGTPRERAREVALAMLERVGLGTMTDRRPGALSGGQQQRVAIARALVREAPVLLMDEPFLNLDYKLREDLREELATLLRNQTGTTVIYASTDPREALQMGDQVVLMAEGRALQSGPPRSVHGRPQSIAAARVVSDPPINLLELEPGTSPPGIRGIDPAALAGSPLSPPEGTHTLGLRAEDLRPGGPLPARVMMSEVTGSETVTHLQCGALALVMLERAVVERAMGSETGLHLDLSRALAFDARGALLERETVHG